MRLVEQIPDLEHCWVRYTPRPWPGDASHLWVDLATGSLGRGGDPGSIRLRDLSTEKCDDLVYLPPVAVSREADREELCARLVDRAVPVLNQKIAGETGAIGSSSAVYDVLHSIATGRLDSLGEVPAGSRVVWPLVSGYSDDPLTWSEGLTLLAKTGVSAVVGIAPELSPAARRRIVDIAGDGGFEALFHGSAPDVRAFAGEAHRQGLEAIPTRPAPSGPERLARNRFLAGRLALIAALWLRLGRSESQAQIYFRASRWIDRETHDLSALAAEGNLGIVTWLDGSSREQIEELLADGSSRLLDELRTEYLEGA